MRFLANPLTTAVEHVANEVIAIANSSLLAEAIALPRPITEIAKLKDDERMAAALACELLEAATQGLPSVETWLMTYAGYIASNVVLAPRLTLVNNGRTRQLDWRLNTADSSPCGLVVFAAYVIATGQIRIGRCQWSECRRFFRIVPRGKQGKPATRYCPNTDHRERGRPNSTDRVRRHRANKQLRKRPRKGG